MTQTMHALGARAFFTAGPHGLSVEDVAATAIARRYGTPVSVVSLGQVRANVHRWRAALADAWPHGAGRVCPSFKANPSTALWRHVATLGTGCDVFGEHELRTALGAGIDAGAISLNGTTKSSALLDFAIRNGVKITVDSLDELDRTAAQARRVGIAARVRLRLRPWLPDIAAESDFSPGTSAYVAIHDYRPGVPADEVARCVAKADADPLLDFVGLHGHIGRQSTDLSLWSEYGRWMAGAIAEIVENSCAVREVSFGGGFAPTGDPTGQGLRRRVEPPPTPEAYLGAMLGAFTADLDTHRGLDIEIEPGRSVFGDAGVHLATAVHVKRQSTPVERVFVETDTSEAFLPDVVWESARFAIVVADDPARHADTVAAVTGISCGLDVLRGPEPTPLPNPGDVVAFLDTGAYQDATANNFNLLGRPPLVLVDGGTCQLARRREIYDDVLAREVDESPERI